jgi:hypothetical protein
VAFSWLPHDSQCRSRRALVTIPPMQKLIAAPGHYQCVERGVQEAELNEHVDSRTTMAPCFRSLINEWCRDKCWLPDMDSNLDSRPGRMPGKRRYAV